jgi:predicted GIY-YIG superfamily endonuclease
MDEVLYRFFDSEGNLLYVGITNNWQLRLKQHYKTSDFHQEATQITLERFSTRLEVEKAELIAIATENPKYNKAFNPKWENPQQHIIKIKNWVYSNTQVTDQHAGIVEELRELFLDDPLWTRKSTGPVALYLQKYLPEWASDYGLDCKMCVGVYHSRQIESWADQAKEARNAAN